MPYTRSIRFETALLGWHDITLLEPVPQWSATYRVTSPRLLVPLTRWLECAISGRRFVCDSVRPLWLTPDDAYCMRQPWLGQRSVVLILNPALPCRAAHRPVLPAQSPLLLAQWAKALDSGGVEVLAAEEQLLEFVQSALRVDTRPTAAVHRAVERAREHLATQPQANDTLSEIAAVAHCSVFHLARQFRRHNGISLHGYRTRLRMALAVQRMAEGERNFSTLAADLGYSSHSHFTASFRRTFGAAPHQVRTNLTAPALH